MLDPDPGKTHPDPQTCSKASKIYKYSIVNVFCMRRTEACLNAILARAKNASVPEKCFDRHSVLKIRIADTDPEALSIFI